MKRLVSLLSLTALAASTGCGAAEVVTPAPLLVLDTYPGNGAIVASGDVPLVLVFSAAVDEDSLDEALLLEEISAAGTPIDVVPTALAEYLAESQTASYTAPDLPPDTSYTITVRQDTLRSTDGQALLTDLVRRFKTSP